MTYREAVSYIASLRSAGMQMGLERMQQGIERLGHPEYTFQSVHIAGTNGKGSTAHMIAAMLRASGHTVGLYTSPYLTEYRDMLLIGDQPISEESFAASATAVRESIPDGLSEYEFLTLLAFHAFRAADVRLAVIECCLGGKTDATNVLPPPLCAVFTPIALDHTAILGDTIEAITLQKAAIAKPPCDIVCAPSMHEEALGILYERAACGGQQVFQPASPAQPVTVDAQGTHMTYDGHALTLRLMGEHQRDNALTALQTLQCLRRHGIRIADEAAVRALEAVTLPCRQEVLSHDPFLLIDGAHNPHGITALCRLLDALKLAPVTLVIGMLADKDTDTCLSLLSPYCEQILCCTPPCTPRALPAEELAAVARRYHARVSVCDDPQKAVENAKKTARQAVIVGGSFYTANAVRQAHFAEVGKDG